MTSASGGTLGTNCGLASLLIPLLDHFSWEGNGQNSVWGRGAAGRRGSEKNHEETTPAPFGLFPPPPHFSNSP